MRSERVHGEPKISPEDTLMQDLKRTRDNMFAKVQKGPFGPT